MKFELRPLLQTKCKPRKNTRQHFRFTKRRKNVKEGWRVETFCHLIRTGKSVLCDGQSVVKAVKFNLKEQVASARKSSIKQSENWVNVKQKYTHAYNA